MNDKYAWIKTALADRGHRQKDVAKAWGVDDAVVSRFIKEGVPELTWDRAQVLSRMLDMTLDELKLRLSENLAPRGRRRAPEPAPSAERARAGQSTTVEEVLAELEDNVSQARKLLPNAKIKVSITYGNGENGG